MRERINRLARGIVDAELPKVLLTPAVVEEELVSDTVYKRELFLSSENNLYIKGLAYSSHPRVRIVNSAFGGLRNHIVYEVDTSWCENGDTIEGSIYFVTNSGELEVPFVFHVEAEASLRILSALNTVEDFVKLAQRDMDMALRLMEFSDFKDAPFMQDMHIRTVWEGLSGHGNRQNALEEFFLALGVKEPIELTLSTAKKVYDTLSDVISDKVVIRKNTWGYIYIEVRADGEFIELPKKVITQSDFENERFDLRFKLHPERMHRGRNFGAIRLLTVHGDVTIRIEASRKPLSSEPEEEENVISKAGVCRYLKLREDYESGSYERAQTLNKLQKELDAIRGANGNSMLLTLFQAETYLDGGRLDQAALCLDDIEDQIVFERERLGTLYCFYQYLRYRTSPDPDKKDALMRLFRKKLDNKKGRFYLQMLMLKIEPSIADEAAALFESFKQQYKNGCSSPFLYIEACRLLEAHPELLTAMDAFEIHALYFGAKNGMVGETLAGVIAALASGSKFFHKLYYKLLCLLYERFPSKEMLTAVCCLLIKGNVKDAESFVWYERGIEEEISLTRLYEYFLYSLPEDYEGMMPKQVLLYFSYEHSHLDRRSRSVLYKNVLTYVEPHTALYQAYERIMEQFAMEQLFESRIDSRLAVIYKHMIYRDIIDRQVAGVLPAILRSNRIVCEDRAMRYVIVSNDFLKGEDAYPLQDGVAYVPLFFDNCVILFQDMYGNRYMDVKYTKESVLDEPELEKKCFEIDPEHALLKMRACHELMEKEELSEEEAGRLEDALDELPVKPLYQQKILTKIIAWYKKQVGEDEEQESEIGTYLLRLDKEKISRAERIDVCETLISQNYYQEAFEMMQKFGGEKLRMTRLLKLCSKMILQNLFDEDELLLQLSYQVFAAGQADSVILDYLCEHFNGTSEDMYKLLVQAVREHVETYDLEERLLAQLMFTGSDQKLDQVFDFYASRKKTSDTIVKAYFTLKCVGYFLKDIVPGDRVFAYLEGAVNASSELRKVPEIYLLALTKFYAGLPSLNEEQQALCKRVMSMLTGQGMIFAYFRELARYADIPGDIMDKEMIEYHGSPDSRPVLKVRILPDEEEFHEEELRMVYKGIYIRQKLLFEGEIMEYEIYEDEDGEPVKKAEGEISCAELSAGDKRNRFSCLNSMSLYLGMKDDKKLKESMSKYVTDNLTVEKLFPLA